MALDAAIADQLTSLTLVGAQSSQQLNGVADRNRVAAVGAVLTLGVQQVNAASLKLLTKIDPMEAASAANLRSSQDPTYFAGLNTTAGTPRSGVIPRPAAG